MKNFDFNSTRATNNRNRTQLTNIVVLSGFILLSAISICIIVISGKTAKQLESAQWVFNAIVPLVASWVGGVIAFYFGRDNYEAATEQVLALSRETLDDISVENIMIHVKTIVAQKNDAKDDANIKLDDLIELYSKIDKDRIPVFSSNLEPRLIIHRSTMVQYINQKSKDQAKDLTLKNMIDDNPNSFTYNKTSGFTIVARNTKLQDAIDEMNKLKDCQDIFVTDNGENTGKVVGWLTNSLINRFLTVTQTK